MGGTRSKGLYRPALRLLVVGLFLLPAPAWAQSLSVTVTVTGETFDNRNAWSIANNSGAGKNITSCTVDLSTASFPGGLVFGTAGGATGDQGDDTDFSTADSATTGLTSPEADPFNDGDVTDRSTSFTMSFDDFDPGETFLFGIDVDDTADDASINGAELDGTKITCTVDGSSLSGNLSPVNSTDSSATLSLVTIASLDHFKCYRAKTAKGTPKFEKRVVTLVDQFRREGVRLTKPEFLCNPVDKEGEGIIDPTAHLKCYKIKGLRKLCATDAPANADEACKREEDCGGQRRVTSFCVKLPRFQKREVLVENQFGTEVLSVVKPKLLCVPSEKAGVPSSLNLDHFKCYKARTARGTPKFEKRVVTLVDQFGEERVTVLKPEFFCNPVDKQGEGIIDPTAHLKCYKIKGLRKFCAAGVPANADKACKREEDCGGQRRVTSFCVRPPRFQKREVLVENQFGTEVLNVVKPQLLCVPSEKTSP